MIGLPGSEGPAAPAPAVKKACVELGSKGGTPPEHALVEVEGTDGLETLGMGEASDEGGLLARLAAKAARTVWVINETIAGEIPSSPLASTAGKPSSEPPDRDIEGTFATSSSPVDGLDIVEAVCRLLFVACEPITER